MKQINFLIREHVLTIDIPVKYDEVYVSRLDEEEETNVPQCME